RWARYEAKRAAVEEGHQKLQATMLTPTPETNAYLTSLGSSALKTGTTAAQLLRRPELSYMDIARLLGWDDPGIDVREELSVSTKYEGYITKQQERIRRQQKMETTQLADDLPYDTLRGISIEARQKLQQIKPATLGQASRVSGVSPADITVLMIYLEQQRRQGVHHDA
ncbi:MAG: tRNA uridine-5-carboxymethylaminomethyl(34) synthesis enzyme MnmG, partial [Negativicoccus succinicivorans]|nr:tRNA uridine-5-carboxymethylaminomethyl(34) synthesis enzyme MnmG [Negativicoccus succinicivorans]